MRSHPVSLTLCLFLALATVACNKPPADSTSDSGDSTDKTSASDKGSGNKTRNESAKESKQSKEAQKKPSTVPAGTSVTISLGSALGSKLSQSGQTFNGSVAKDVMVGNDVVIPKGSNVSGTVTNAKALGKLAGGSILEVRLDSISLNGHDLPVQAGVRTFSGKGKGKRTAVATGGGAALGGIVGALAGGGKGAAIGMAAGAGAGAGGSALTGNKDIVLPSESAITFELTQQIELQRM